MARSDNKGRGWKSKLGMHLLFLGLGILFLFIYSWLDITCLLRYITGIPCPTCGATRAMFSLARLDFVGYWFYNPMAFPLVIAFLAVFHIKLLPKWRILIYVYVGIVLVLTVVLYIYRLMYGLIL
ncbi:MAG: hypothetical protein FD141_560 [Fusobacteria bacterium]|nr:MAG: hypothetical protein FD141_560 [Fusobacteriota bacterium]KAF0228774.1 MAG: hypothetical protein FD182_1030 [Fusobacteriota bacterium]